MKVKFIGICGLKEKDGFIDLEIVYHILPENEERLGELYNVFKGDVEYCGDCLTRVYYAPNHLIVGSQVGGDFVSAKEINFVNKWIKETWRDWFDYVTYTGYPIP